uniref:Metalloendopeptidase n=1 Tax=Parastrongyloides trichosuri TaxID=131310 RepID=A0A0N4ZDB3_PARTI
MIQFILLSIFYFIIIFTKSNETRQSVKKDSSYRSDIDVLFNTSGDYMNGTFSNENYTFDTAKSIYTGYPDWSFPIKYHISKSLSYPQYTKVIKSVIRSIEAQTCITFQEVSDIKDNEPGLIFVHDSSICGSFVGKDPRNIVQKIFLAYDCAEGFGYVAHEVGHALGLSHEHTRYDRDNYITIFKDHIINDKNILHNVMYKEDKNYKTLDDSPYDYGSVMHYRRFDFVTNYRFGVEGYEAMKAKNIEPYSWMMGQRKQYSFSDFKQLNLHYCDKKCNDFYTVSCKNGGYRNYKTCTRCICPRGYGGYYCEHIERIPGKCSDGTLVAIDKLTYLIAKGPKDCNYLIKAEDGISNIYLRFGYVRTMYKDVCAQGNGLEIRHEENKGKTGLCLCGGFYGLEIVSDSSQVYIEFHGVFYNSEFQLRFAMMSRFSTRPYLCWQNVCYEKEDNYYVKKEKNYRNIKIQD